MNDDHAVVVESAEETTSAQTLKGSSDVMVNELVIVREFT